ncbi:MarR family transcriptional regulator [Maricaulis sp.]|uniref:MarR family winged helix-turn-helix transcriptional regulator n=1 Tax=Maricaulis sp. TaxID=1486257 RepID=UPI0026257366|nr:MarR family transcriptional regulator [Maricaulis sp.]
MSTTPPPDDPSLFVFFNEVGIIHQLAMSAFTRVLPDGLLPAHFSMLNHMVRLGDGWSPARLASAFQVTKGAVTNTLTRLEARGLIEVRPDEEDGRKKRVFITAAGRAAREKCIAALAPMLVEMERELGQGVFEQSIPSLRAVRQFLDRARD